MLTSVQNVSSDKIRYSCFKDKEAMRVNNISKAYETRTKRGFSASLSDQMTCLGYPCCA